ncbi:kinase-like domain-containing protein [Xylaria castorea]|nr:kinase-like domain-containing protein [Xylaria castorea]
MVEITERELRSRVQREQHRLRHVFGDSKGWELETFLGNGSFGITVLLRDSDPLHLRSARRDVWGQKRVVLKWALFPQLGIQDFITEIKALKFLRGKAHHPQIIAATIDVTNYRPFSVPSVGDIFRRIIAPFINPPSNIFKILRGNRGPAILLEYIENGSLQKLSQRAWRLNIDFPNRLLWSFYLCLVRACAGLHYPHVVPKPGDGPLVLETITRPEPNGFAHNDIALRNIMVGRSDHLVAEHGIMPRLHLIDYGLSTDIPNSKQAVRDNLFGITVAILHLINPNLGPISNTNTMAYNGIMTYATDILPMLGRDEFPFLDPELRQLLVEAVAVDPNLRPSIQDMFRRTLAGKEKVADAYADVGAGGPLAGIYDYETNEFISRLLQQLVLDADIV